MYSLTKATEIFTKHYEMGNQDISQEVLKYNTHKLRHSNGVLEVGRNLLIKIKENTTLSSETINRSEIVCFLHDVARFYQNNKERVLSNAEFEHGDESALICKQEWYDEKVCLAIKYHNKYSLDDIYHETSYLNMNETDKKETEFLAKFIRDADKLQNMIYTIFFIEWLSTLNPKLSSWDISPLVLEDLKKEIPVNRDNIKTYADDVVWVLCRVYDINFKESIDMLNFYWYFEKIITETSKLEWVSQESIEIVKKHILNYKL